MVYLGEVAALIPLTEGPTAEKCDPVDQKDITPRDGVAPQVPVPRRLSAARPPLMPAHEIGRLRQGGPHFRVPHADRGPGRSTMERERQLRVDFAL